MKIQQDLPRAAAGTRAAFVSRWLFSGAFLGLLIGLFEARLLWTTPRVIPLLTPDVGWVIWFLAPLVDMIFFALAGFVLGWLASRSAHKEVFVAANAALAVTFIYLMFKWFHIEIGLHPFKFNMEVVIPSFVFAAAFAVSLVLLAVAGRRLAKLWERWMPVLMKPLGCGLAAATVAAVAGIAVFAIWPPISGTAAPTTVPPPSGAPNIVFIVLDTVRADHLSSYGYSRPTTPNIDRFARTGVLFENAIAPTSWTLASHASMFTGLLPQQHGADWAVPLASNPWTLAEILRSRGYQTAGFIGNGLYLDEGWGTAQGFEAYDDLRPSVRHNLGQTLLGNAVVQPLYQNFCRYDGYDRRTAQQLNAGIFRWYRNHSHRPSFVFVNYFDAHDPYLPPNGFGRRFGPVSMDVMRRYVWSLLTVKGYPAGMSTGDRARLVDAYDNCLAYLDLQVGKLLNFLQESPEWKNTIVIITSDHGEGLGRHDTFDHGRDLYRELLHVPLIVAGPGIPKDMQISHVVGTRQLFSTVLDLAGHGRTPFSRTSLARFWNPDYKPVPSDNAVVSELIPVFDADAQRSMMSLTTTQWEYIAHRDGRQELYNWVSDPEEKDNLAESPGQQATLEGLRSHLVSLVSEATGPWRGMAYLSALNGVASGPQLSLLYPQPLVPGAAGHSFRIGIAQAYFKPSESSPTRPTQSEQDVMRSLPYQ